MKFKLYFSNISKNEMNIHPICPMQPDHSLVDGQSIWILKRNEENI